MMTEGIEDWSRSGTERRASG